jgi:hypothetical protein
VTFISYFVSIPFLRDYFSIPIEGVANHRFVIYHHIGICLEDNGYLVGQFGTTLGVKGVEEED